MFKDIQIVLVNPVTLPLVAIALLCIAVFWTLIALRPDIAPKPYRFSQNPMMNSLAWGGIVLALPAILVVESLFYALLNTSSITDPVEQSTAFRNYGLLLAAIIGVPFLVWRSFVAQKQVDIAEQGHITDRINKAVEGLGAEKTVKDGEDEKTVPNHEVRVGAIYALERIAQDSDRDHIQIMEILCAYIRENAPSVIAELSPHDVWNYNRRATAGAKGISLREREDHEVPHKAGLEPSLEDLQSWSYTLRSPRTDIRVALEVIGRRAKRQIALERSAKVRGSKVGYQLDLRETCLQRAELAEMDFKHALFGLARMQGADLKNARMQGAYLSRAEMDCADLMGAQMQGADLSTAQLQCAFLTEAQMQGVDLSKAEMQGAYLGATQMQGAAARGGDYQNVSLSQDQVDQLFGDVSVVLPSALNRPKWPVEILDNAAFEIKWREWQQKIGYDPTTDTP